MTTTVHVDQTRQTRYEACREFDMLDVDRLPQLEPSIHQAPPGISPILSLQIAEVDARLKVGTFGGLPVYVQQYLIVAASVETEDYLTGYSSIINRHPI